jgi:hypothetical protein
MIFAATQPPVAAEAARRQIDGYAPTARALPSRHTDVGEIASATPGTGRSVPLS